MIPVKEFFRGYLREVRGRFYQTFYSKNRRLELDRSIVSLTFDDVPHGTFENAVPMLNRVGYRATFYISGRMAEQSSLPGSTRDFVSFQEARWLHEQGHEIGCHTFSHRRP